MGDAYMHGAMNMKIIIDTREQIPLEFEPDIETCAGTLRAGDYSLAGFTEAVAIERKELGDFIACCGQERERFKAELQRLKAYEARAIVIEADMGQIIQRAYRSRIKPESVMGSMASWTLRYQVPFILAGDRDGATRFIVAMFRNYLNQLQETQTALMLNMERASHVQA